MIPRRFILSAIALASLATACTALVLGKVGDTDDYKTLPPGVSPASPGELDECSLLKGDYYAVDRDANACATCIQTNCASDVTYACNAGASKSPKPWFDKMKDCARDPWNGYKPPSEPSGGFGYGCRLYETPAEEISDNGSDAEREPQAHNCINSNCLQGTLPACKQCEVHVRKSASSAEEALLRDDPCGKCLVESCQPELVRCCDSDPVDDFVTKCAFTAAPSNKAICRELGKELPDAGNNSRGYGDAGTQCLDAISACFKANCAGLPACN